jgi:hypothetical protein
LVPTCREIPGEERMATLAMPEDDDDGSAMRIEDCFGVLLAVVRLLGMVAL